MRTSPCAVMNTMGMSMRRRRSSSWNSRPFMPGRRMSSTRQLGTSRCAVLRNSSVDAKTVAFMPTDSSRSVTASRTDASSSITNTVGEPLAICLLRNYRDGEMQHGPAARPWCCPDFAFMRFDDGAADRQPHAGAAWLCGEERIEYSLRVFRIQPGAAICDADSDLSVTLDRANQQFFSMARHFGHCVHPVHDEIQHDLL